ncbi:MAG: hypothetical protein AVDCRST_MAG13-951, partial [uncultured Solirubrobacteraceae bacterium]
MAAGSTGAVDTAALLGTTAPRFSLILAFLP